MLDADIWGYSVPRMLGVDGRLAGEVRDDRKLMVPNERAIGDGVVRVVSMGFLVDDEGSALMWRGLMLNRGVQHFLQDVDWGDDLDYLLIDMPPGTGDVQMGVAKLVPRAEVIIVTTPALAAQKVAVRAASMARKNYLRIAGVIENMSAFTCEHGESYPLFGEGGGEACAREAGAPLLGSVPLEPAVAAGADTGTPVALGDGPGGRCVPCDRGAHRRRGGAARRDGGLQRPSPRSCHAGTRRHRQRSRLTRPPSNSGSIVGL